jgi:hypothetical protein
VLAVEAGPGAAPSAAAGPASAEAGAAEVAWEHVEDDLGLRFRLGRA